jgi:ClpP class serine protease
MLALDPGTIRQGPQGFFWMFGGGPVPSERLGEVAVVHVRGALDHHADSYDDNYETILKRLREASTGEDVVTRHAIDQKRHKYEHGLDDDFEPLPDVEATKPSSVLLCIDSPGGVVSGLNECVYAMRRMQRETGVPIDAYVNELAASAAFALCCGCRNVYAPPAAIIGSIGVISTMVSQARANERDGIDVVLITSGARKADGHVHAEITDGAIASERGRVDKLARTFFRIAAKARGLSVAKVKSLQAAIYLANDAQKIGLVDEVVSFDEAISGLQPDDTTTDTQWQNAGGNETDRRANNQHPKPRAQANRLDANSHNRSTLSHESGGNHGAQMLKIRALIKKTEAAISKETDPKKLLALAADLKAYKKTEKHVEHTSSEEGEDAPDNDGDGDDDGDESSEEEGEEEEASSSKGKAKAPPGGEEDGEEEEEKATAAAALRTIEAATGRKGSAAIGAALARFAISDRTAADVKAMKAEANAAKRSALVARASRYIAPHLVKATTSAMTLAGLQAYVEEAEKGEPMVITAEGDLLKPRTGTPGTEASLPKEVIAMIDEAVAACGLIDPKAHREKLVTAALENHTKQLAKAPRPGDGGY